MSTARRIGRGPPFARELVTSASSHPKAPQVTEAGPPTSSISSLCCRASLTSANWNCRRLWACFSLSNSCGGEEGGQVWRGHPLLSASARSPRGTFASQRIAWDGALAVCVNPLPWAF